MSLAKALRVAGRILLAHGCLLVLFAVHRQWGTGIYEARAQDRLESDFEEALAAGADPAIADGTSSVAERRSRNVSLSAPDDGEPVARIVIPAIGMDKIVVEGVRTADLKRGPGHFPSTVLPGQEGNAAMAGHRNTYGAPFNRLDELEAGDEVLVTTLHGAIRYRVDGWRIVEPQQVEVLEDFGDNRLTLVACHPEHSEAQRIVVTAKLEDPPLQHPAQAREIAQRRTSPELYASSRSDPLSAWPAVLFGGTCGLVWAAAMAATRFVPRCIAYCIAAAVSLVPLFFFFEALSPFLPTSVPVGT